MNLSTIELSRKLKDAGYEEHYIEMADPTKKKLVNGDIYFKTLPSGIDIHYCDVVENVNGQSTSQLDACISINFLLKGQVSFALSNKRYDMEIKDNNNSPIVFINILNSEHLFTRYFHQDQHVTKLNITVSKPWLISRCINEYEIKEVESLFLNPQSVYQWKCTEVLLASAKSLFTISKNRAKAFQWDVEQKAFLVFCQSFQLLKEEMNKGSITTPSTKAGLLNNNTYYEKKITSIINERLTLDEIAPKLGASISTLQRYFKAKYKLTLKEYIRNQKLEEARRELIFTKKSIGEISYNAGYKHVSNFSSAFKKYFSIPPAELQKEYKNLSN
jgi:AraC-like DNA-binding protein